MKAINAYLTFDGNCRQAMEFYAKTLGAELMMMTWGEMPPGNDETCPVTPETKDRIMHASLRKGDAILMAADGMPGAPPKVGNNFTINIDCENVKESEEFFAALSAGGKVTMPPTETFWAERFAMFTDRFGITWMLNVSKPQTDQAHA